VLKFNYFFINFLFKKEKVLEESLNDDIALLIVGDPFGATTQ